MANLGSCKGEAKVEASLVAHATIIAVQRKNTVKNKPNTSLNIVLIYYYISPCHLVSIMSYYFLGSVVVQLNDLTVAPSNGHVRTIAGKYFSYFSRGKRV